MTNYSSASTPSSFVRKFTDSVVIGSQQAQLPRFQSFPSDSSSSSSAIVVVPPSSKSSYLNETPSSSTTTTSSTTIPQDICSSSQKEEQEEKREGSSSSSSSSKVFTVDFKLKIPLNALRIDMTILVSTNDKSVKKCGSPLRPSVSYKITICVPRHRPQSHDNEEQQATTMMTVYWSSKFNVTKDLDDCINPFYEWTGSFDIGEQPATPIGLDGLLFYPIQGTFLGNYDDHHEDAAKTAADPKMQQAKGQENCRRGGFEMSLLPTVTSRMKKLREEDDEDDDLITFCHPNPRKRRRRRLHSSNENNLRIDSRSSSRTLTA